MKRHGSWLFVAGIIGIALVSAPASTASDEWEFQIAPYLWAAGIDGDVTLAGQDAAVDAGFSDILDIFDGGGMLHFEAGRGRWSVLSDVFFIDLGSELESPSGELDYEQWIVDGAAAYGVTENVEVFVGARYTRIDSELRLSGPMLRLQGDRSWTDPMVGARWTRSFGDRWGLGLRGDVGGFGVESDLTWQVRATASYRFSDRFFLGFGLRALDYDFEEGQGVSRFAYDVTMSGAEIGVGFNF